mmetsp:Transcript_45582/g.145414  ORF Transcript_45582/g.145414 Transcript_45582/m.145414 type:complete len:308 (-) Transcript_45582:547-1470(-)
MPVLGSPEHGLEGRARLLGHGQEALGADDLPDGAAEDDLGRVTHPGVEDAVGGLGTELVGVEVAGDLGLLGEGHHVRRRRQAPVLKGPHFAGRPDARLHLVDDESGAVPRAELLDALEESRGGVEVPALALHGLHDDTGHMLARPCLCCEDLFGLLQATALLGSVLLGVLLQGVAEPGEGGSRPLQCGHVELVDGLGAGRRECSEGAAVKTAVKAEDYEILGTAGQGVRHAAGELCLAEVQRPAALGLALLRAEIDEGRFESVLVGAGAAGHGLHVSKACRRDGEQRSLQFFGPIRGRQEAQGGPVH